MKTETQNKNWLKKASNRVTWAWLALAAPWLSGPAQAASEPELPGYYEGDFVRSDGEKTDAKLWIKQVTQRDGSKSRYAMLLRNDGKNGAQVFRVDDVGQGKQLWLQLFQSQDGLLQFGSDATYDGTLYWRKDVASIILTVTPYGSQVGCTESVQLKSKDGPGWVDFLQSSLDVDGSSKPRVERESPESEGSIDSRSFTGRIVLGGEVYAGSYTLQKIFPGAALMHLSSVTLDAIDGHKVTREITALVAITYHPHWWIFKDTSQFEFIRLEPGKERCLDPDTTLED